MTRNNKAYTITEFDEELLEILTKEYTENNMSLRKLQEKYNVNRSKLAEVFEELGVKTTKGNHYRTYFHDFNYFEKIDNHEKAYWLGFIMADGYIQQNKNKNYGEDNLGIALCEDDKVQLEYFKKAIKATNPIKTYKQKTQQKWIDQGYYVSKNVSRILLTSQKTCDDLIDKGVIYQKSTIKEFPSFNKVPEKFIYSYIRGYLDGNGSIGLIKNKTISNSLYCSFATSQSFAEGLQQIIGGYITHYKNRNCSELKLKVKDTKRELPKIYKRSTPETRLHRKYEKYINNI